MGVTGRSNRSALVAARRALLAKLAAAIRGMQRPHTPDALIHDIRKELKHARAALRLLRQYDGSREYRRRNAAIRDAARPLTALRDAKIVLETLRDLVPARRPAVTAFARRLRSELTRQRSAERRRVRPRDLRRAAALLRVVRRRIEASSRRRPGSDAPQPIDGLKHAFKRGRSSYRQARHRRTDDRLHEWRKQTKYFAGQLEILEPFGPTFFAKRRRQAERLADALGDDHDLAALAGQIRRVSGGLRGAQRQAAAALLDRLVRRRAKLQRRAFRLGARLYAARPRRYQL